MDYSQEWRSENNNRFFPFVEGSSVPRGFISDIKFFHDRTTQESVYLSYVNYEDGAYTLRFNFVSDDELAISSENSSPVPIDGEKKTVYLFGANNESVVMFAPGPLWFSLADGPAWSSPFVFTKDDSRIDTSLVTSGPRMIRRIVIHEENSPPVESEWRKETVQALKGGYNLNLALLKNEFLSIGDTQKDIIEISAVSGGGDGNYEDPSMSGILTINGIPPTSNNINIGSKDCLKVVDRPNNINNSIRIMSDCLPCCGCHSYQKISDAITYRWGQLKQLNNKLNEILRISAEEYNSAIAAISRNKRPVARIRGIRVKSDRIIMALQNTCSLPVYARYGVTISSVPIFRNISPRSVPVSGLDAPGKYNLYNNTDTNDIPTGTFTGTLGPIQAGGYTDLTFVTTLNYGDDLRNHSISLNLQANGYFGSTPMLGCMKDVYNVSITPDTTTPNEYCSSKGNRKKYNITAT
jgi:hypothetical protein